MPYLVLLEIHKFPVFLGRYFWGLVTNPAITMKLHPAEYQGIKNNTLSRIL